MKGRESERERKRKKEGRKRKKYSFNGYIVFSNGNTETLGLGFFSSFEVF